MYTPVHSQMKNLSRPYKVFMKDYACGVLSTVSGSDMSDSTRGLISVFISSIFFCRVRSFSVSPVRWSPTFPQVSSMLFYRLDEDTLAWKQKELLSVMWLQYSLGSCFLMHLIAVLDRALDFPRTSIFQLFRVHPLNGSTIWRRMQAGVIVAVVFKTLMFQFWHQCLSS